MIHEEPRKGGNMTGAQAAIAIIGLGAIGRPMAERIAAAGLPPVVCGRGAAAGAGRDGASAGWPEAVVRAASREDAATRADIVLTCLPSIDSHRKALLAPGG